MIGYTQMIKWLRRNSWQKNQQKNPQKKYYFISLLLTQEGSLMFFNKIICHTASLVTGDCVDPNTVLFIY